MVDLGFGEVGGEVKKGKEGKRLIWEGREIKKPSTHRVRV